MKKRFLALGTALAVSAIMMVGCGATEKADDTAADTTQNTEAEETGAAEEADNTVEESTDTNNETKTGENTENVE